MVLISKGIKKSTSLQHTCKKEYGSTEESKYGEESIGQKVYHALELAGIKSPE
jgi:hypothetical protein